MNIGKIYNMDIPSDQNLTINEIKNYLDEIDTVINDAVEKTTPKLKLKNKLNELVNFKIKKLHTRKQKIQTEIHKKNIKKTRLVKMRLQH